MREDLSREELREIWEQRVYKFPHEVILTIRDALDIEPVVQDSQRWCNEQGWRRGPSFDETKDWNVDYRDNGRIGVFGFHDPQKAMLFKLTWSDYL